MRCARLGASSEVRWLVLIGSYGLISGARSAASTIASRTIPPINALLLRSNRRHASRARLLPTGAPWPRSDCAGSETSAIRLTSTTKARSHEGNIVQTPLCLGGFVSSWLSPTLLIPNAWVDRGVQHVYDQVDQHVGHRREQHCALD